MLKDVPSGFKRAVPTLRPNSSSVHWRDLRPNGSLRCTKKGLDLWTAVGFSVVRTLYRNVTKRRNAPQYKTAIAYLVTLSYRHRKSMAHGCGRSMWAGKCVHMVKCHSPMSARSVDCVVKTDSAQTFRFFCFYFVLW